MLDDSFQFKIGAKEFCLDELHIKRIKLEKIALHKKAARKNKRDYVYVCWNDASSKFYKRSENA